jgi:hypothetical protein
MLNACAPATRLAEAFPGDVLSEWELGPRRAVRPANGGQKSDFAGQPQALGSM